MNVVSNEDPLKKREEFAVSLRKKKTKQILQAKRLKREQNMAIMKTTNMEWEANSVNKACAEFGGYEPF